VLGGWGFPCSSLRAHLIPYQEGLDVLPPLLTPALLGRFKGVGRLIQALLSSSNKGLGLVQVSSTSPRALLLPKGLLYRLRAFLCAYIQLPHELCERSFAPTLPYGSRGAHGLFAEPPRTPILGNFSRIRVKYRALALLGTAGPTRNPNGERKGLCKAYATIRSEEPD